MTRTRPSTPRPTSPTGAPWRGPITCSSFGPGQRPRLIRYAPEDFWYEQVPLGSPFWASEFEIEEAGTVEEAWKRLGTLSRAAYIGNETDRAEAAGLELNPALLTAHLDWHRTTKSPYEVQCIEEATVIAAGRIRPPGPPSWPEPASWKSTTPTSRPPASWITRCPTGASWP